MLTIIFVIFSRLYAFSLTVTDKNYLMDEFITIFSFSETNLNFYHDEFVGPLHIQTEK